MAIRKKGEQFYFFLQINSNSRLNLRLAWVKACYQNGSSFEVCGFHNFTIY